MIELKVVIRTVCGKDAAVELTGNVLTACLENNFQLDSGIRRQVQQFNLQGRGQRLDHVTLLITHVIQHQSVFLNVSCCA